MEAMQRDTAQTAPERIAIMLPDLRGGGAERMRLNLAADWLAQGFAVDFVLLRKRGELVDLVPHGATITALGVDRYRSAVGPLVAYLRETRPDVLLAAMWPLTVVAILGARLSRLPIRVVVSDHNALSKAYADRGLLHRLALGASMALTYPFADARVAVSEGVAHDLSRLCGLGANRFDVVYNPAAAATGAQTRGWTRPAELDPHARVILNVGTLKAQKDHALLIEAFARMQPNGNVQLCILGEGVLRTSLEALIQERQLSGRVVLPGFVADPTPYYRAADLFVLSSKYEGFGNVIVEALDHGVPVVSTNCQAGPSEILADGRFGTLVPVSDPDALAAAMQQALDMDHDREALKRRAREFAPDVVARKYMKLMLPDWNGGATFTQKERLT